MKGDVMKLKAVFLFAASAFLFEPNLAAAQAVNSAMIIDALKTEKAGPVVRSMSTVRKRGISISGQIPVDIDLPKVSLTINFDLGSANLTNDGMISLRSLAKALVSPQLANLTFQIAGHTDGRGDLVMNQGLSERRATTVVNHLVRWYEIPRERLVPIGYGLSRPLDPSDLLNPVNRRVEVINTAPLS